MSETKNGMRIRRILLSWEFNDDTAFQLSTSAETGATLDMLDELVRVKRVEIAKLSAPPKESTP